MLKQKSQQGKAKKEKYSVPKIKKRRKLLTQAILLLDNFTLKYKQWKKKTSHSVCLNAWQPYAKVQTISKEKCTHSSYLTAWQQYAKVLNDKTLKY